MARPGTFKKGNRVAIANRGPNAPLKDFMSQGLRSRLQEAVKSGKRKGEARYEAILDAIIRQATLGDARQIETCFDRTEGRPAQAVIVSGDSSRDAVQIVEHIIVDSKSRAG